MKNLKEVKDVDFKELSNQLSKITGYFIELSRTIEKDRYGKWAFEVKSQELKDFTGIMKNFYNSFIISGYGAIVENKVININLYFYFKYTKGGSNGTSLCSCWYEFETKKWIIKIDID